MNANNCSLVKDLLPLYAEGLCSEESRQLVAAHLADCEACNAELRKMNTEIHVKADADISAIRRIRRRIRIERIGIALAVSLALFAAFYLAVFRLLNTASEMNYTRYDFENTIHAEADQDGNLWLVRESFAAGADLVIPTYLDANGNQIDGEEHTDQVQSIGYTLMQRKIDSFGYAEMYSGIPVRTFICNINENDVQSVFYCETESNTKHMLWERG